MKDDGDALDIEEAVRAAPLKSKKVSASRISVPYTICCPRIRTPWPCALLFALASR